jgi:hypothetical protein
VAWIWTLLTPAGTVQVVQPCVVNVSLMLAADAGPASASADDADNPAALATAQPAIAVARDR